MSYLVLARKYRPPAFEGVAGQAQVTKALQNAIVRGRVGHAYLFAGPRGVGKTSIARIFSKCLNCETGPTVTPCLTCSNCRDIAQGTSLSVREIDGASHNSVDNVRDLIESFRTLPPPGSQYKVYIIDEVHMLSTSAFNALLKSLEEPPPNTIFILATTELHKIPETVLSRCQRHTLRALPINLVEEELAKIANAESIQCEPGALRLIARLSDGSMRDAQSLLDRISAYVDTTLTEEETGKVLGVVGKQGLFKLSAAIIERDSATALLNIHDSFLQGVEPGVLLRDFAHHWRDLLLIRFGAQAAISALHLAPEEVDEAKRQIGQISAIDLQDLVDLARSGADEALRSVHPRYALESLIVRMSTREPTHDLVKLVGTAVASLKSGKANAVPSERSSVKTNRGQGAAPALPSAGEISVAAPKKVVATAAEQAIAARNNEENQPASSLSTSTSHAQSRSGEPLRWENFVDATAQTGSRILGEHLRRLVVHTFERGVLEASGAEFTVASLSRGAGLERLQQALQSFSGIAPWRVNLSKSGSEENTIAPLSASIEGKEIATRQKSRQKKEEIIRQEPGVKAILEAFPGSTIERIDISENKK